MVLLALLKQLLQIQFVSDFLVLFLESLELSLRIFEPFLGVFDFVQLALESDCVLSANALEVGGVSVLL